MSQDAIFYFFPHSFSAPLAILKQQWPKARQVIGDKQFRLILERLGAINRSPES